MTRGAALWSWSAFTFFVFHFKQLHVRPNSLQMGSRGLFKISAIKGSLLWELCSPVKKKTRKKRASEVLSQLSTSIPQIRQQIWLVHAIPPLTCCHCHFPGNAQMSHLPWFPYLFLSREHGASGTSEDWLYMIPVQIKNSLFQADTVAEEGGHGEHLETRCSAVCQHHLPDLTHRRVRLCTLAWTGMCQARQLCTKTHAHT